MDKQSAWWLYLSNERQWCRADSRFAPSQWETALLCNDVLHWLGASPESALWWVTLNNKAHQVQQHCSITVLTLLMRILEYSMGMGQCHSCWCLGPLRRLGISSYEVLTVCRINVSLSLARKDFNYLRHLNVDKIEISFHLTSTNLWRQLALCGHIILP